MNKFSVNRVKKKKVDYTKEDVRMADEYIKVINTRSETALIKKFQAMKWQVNVPRE